MKTKQMGFISPGWALIIFVAGFLIWCAVKMTPAYVENIYVKDALKFLVSNNADVRELDKSEILSQLSKYATINSLGQVQSKSFKVRRYDDRLIVDSVYEVRVPIALNVDAVMSFANQLDTASPDACCEYLIDAWDENKN